MAQSKEEPTRLCQCPMGVVKCAHDMTQEDLLCDRCREVHKPNFPDGLALPAGERIDYPPGHMSTEPIYEPTLRERWERVRFARWREEFLEAGGGFEPPIFCL